jgi:AcrR family transcriptional regulator
MKSQSTSTVAPRRYTQVARAEAAEETGRRILEAASELFRAHDYADVTLQAIAGRAGVTLQTVLRRFESKERLFSTTARVRGESLMQSREPERPRDTAAALRALVASYETMGDFNWRALRAEHQFPVLHEMLGHARAGHRSWLERQFGHLLPPKGRERERRIVRLFVATDFYVWKLLRLDLGLSVAETLRTMGEQVAAVVGPFPGAPRRRREERGG